MNIRRIVLTVDCRFVDCCFHAERVHYGPDKDTLVSTLTREHVDKVDRALDLRSEDLGFDSHCWSCVEVSGKLLIPYCLCPSRSNGYLVDQKIGKL